MLMFIKSAILNLTHMYTQREQGRRPECGRVTHFIERTGVMHRTWDFKLHLVSLRQLTSTSSVQY